MALEIAQRIGNRSLELRSATTTRRPERRRPGQSATRNLAEAAEVARTWRRGMYLWLLGMTSVWQLDQGERWDENLAALKED